MAENTIEPSEERDPQSPAWTKMRPWRNWAESSGAMNCSAPRCKADSAYVSYGFGDGATEPFGRVSYCEACVVSRGYAVTEKAELDCRGLAQREMADRRALKAEAA